MLINEKQKQFIKLLESTARSRSMVDVFGDAVHMMACSLWSPLALGKQGEVEADFKRIRQNYTDAEYENIQKMFALVAESLEVRREEMLGTILEEIGASNTRNGQFLTPTSVAKMMADITAEDLKGKHKSGEIVKINDCACGASVLLIEQAESLLLQGIPQRDILIIAGDIDQRACDMSFVELSLLGYAAKVEHMDSLSLKEFSPPRYTVGYFLHAMPMRLMWKQESHSEEVPPPPPPMPPPAVESIIRKPEQMFLF